MVKNDFFMGWSSTVFKLDEKWWNFDELWSICGHRLKTWRLTEFSRENARFWSEFGSRFSSTHSTGGIKIGLTLKIDISTHRKVMDKPSGCLAKLITKFKFSFKKWLFVTPSVVFYVNFPKNRDFDGLDKAVMDILNLMCSNGPGWWIGAQGCLERGLESSRSILRSKLI